MQAKRRTIVFATVVGLLAISGLAMANDDYDENDDGVLNIATDGEYLFWNTTFIEDDDDIEDLWDACALENEGSFGYEVEGDEVELADVVELDGYTDDTCEPIQVGDVTADGHPWNHGAIMSYVNAHWYYEGTGKGCVNSQVAQMDLGKGDSDPEGEIVFDTVAVDCQHGNIEEQDAQGADSSGKGRDKWGDDKPGKSGDAPGHSD